MAYAPGTVTLDVDKFIISNQGAASAGGYIVRQLAYPRAPLTWSKPRSFKLRARVDLGNDTNLDMTINTGNHGANRRGFGFRFKKDRIQGFTKNGGAEVNVDLITGKVPPWSGTYLFEAILTPGVKVDFYIDGVLKGTNNTGIPTGTTDAQRLMELYMLSAAAVWHYIYTSMFRVIQDE